MAQDPFNRKLPYLVRPRKSPASYTDDDKIKEEEWLKKREERRKAYSPSGWWSYFMDCHEIPIRNGDSLGLWATKSLPDSDEDDGDQSKNLMPYILMLHGGGYSGLTWAPMVDELSRLIVAEYGALDLRGHGESECKNEEDLSSDTLTQDVVDAIQWLQGDLIKLGQRPLILVGHSMGGALGVNVALKIQENESIRLAGLVVLDVVEGSAMMALSTMHSVLRSRPQEFKTLSDAIQWCIRSGQTKNLDSARISITGQLKMESNGKLATQFVNRHGGVEEPCDSKLVPKKKRVWSKIDEEDNNTTESSDICPPPSSASSSDHYVWRIDLSKTEPYWRGWFEGLSKKFLSVKCPKLLMLAGVDRLDKELTVGQMQGKFQMQVFHQVGHAVHEDIPEKAAECVASFLHRQRLVQTKARLPASLPGC